eukprot:TRINITY_DN44291_c0_g1_i1.p1 TRINITY_DN44291_c0_g1~~TRINITY_DN44291_c0_g1_i1.p1  ORF type:complete len:445 (-),score=56.95 TRINITY_DN44291_c0_g1_i1:232-1488(-)
MAPQPIVPIFQASGRELRFNPATADVSIAEDAFSAVTRRSTQTRRRRRSRQRYRNQTGQNYGESSLDGLFQMAAGASDATVSAASAFFGAASCGLCSPGNQDACLCGDVASVVAKEAEEAAGGVNLRSLVRPVPLSVAELAEVTELSRGAGGRSRGDTSGSRHIDDTAAVASASPVGESCVLNVPTDHGSGGAEGGVCEDCMPQSAMRRSEVVGTSTSQAEIDPRLTAGDVASVDLLSGDVEKPTNLDLLGDTPNIYQNDLFCFTGASQSPAPCSSVVRVAVNAVTSVLAPTVTAPPTHAGALAILARDPLSARATTTSAGLVSVKSAGAVGAVSDASVAVGPCNGRPQEQRQVPRPRGFQDLLDETVAGLSGVSHSLGMVVHRASSAKRNSRREPNKDAFATLSPLCVNRSASYGTC